MCKSLAEQIEGLRNQYEDSLLLIPLDERSLILGSFDLNIDQVLRCLSNYNYDVKYALDYGLSTSMISRLTINLLIVMSRSYKHLQACIDVTKPYLLDERYTENLHNYDKFSSLKDACIRLIENLKATNIFLTENIEKDNYLNDFHIKKGLNDEEKPLMSFEKRLSYMNGPDLLSCLEYMLNIYDSKLVYLRNGFYWGEVQQMETYYDLNLLLYVAQYWPEDGKNYRAHVADQELMNDVTLVSLRDYYKSLVSDFKTNPMGKIWEEYSEDKAKTASEMKKQEINNEQWRYYFKTIMRMKEIRYWIEDIKNQTKSTRGKKKVSNFEKFEKSRETMTFKRKSSVLDGHLTLLFNKLIEVGWIEGNEADFKALFSGISDPDCVITWLGVFGKATLFMLFKAFSKAGLILVPSGYAISTIIEGHFKDKSGQWLSGLAKGNKPHVKAYPVIMECVKLLQTDPRRLAYGNDQDDDDFQAKFDPFDHQDLQMHKR